MKRRIFLYNTVSVLVSLVALLAVNGLVMRWITGRYLAQSQVGMDERSAQVQAILTQWEPASDTWQELAEQLQTLEYGLHVAVRGHEIYSSLDRGRPICCTEWSPAAGWRMWPHRSGTTA